MIPCMLAVYDLLSGVASKAGQCRVLVFAVHKHMHSCSSHDHQDTSDSTALHQHVDSNKQETVLGLLPISVVDEVVEETDHALFCPSCCLTRYAWYSGIHVACVQRNLFQIA